MWTLLALSIVAAAADSAPAQDVGLVHAEPLRGRVWHDDSPIGEGSFRMTCVMEYLGSRGEVTKTLVLEHRRSFTGGRVREELLSAQEDGRDVTERERRKHAEAAGDRQASSSRWSVDEALAPPLPFLAGRAQMYLVSVEGRGDLGPRLAYRPSQQAGGRVATGWVELDPADGLPRRHQFVPVPLPRMIRSLVTTVRYRRLGGIAVPESSESIGNGGLLFIKRRFRVTMTYRDWQLGPSAIGGLR